MFQLLKNKKTAIWGMAVIIMAVGFFLAPLTGFADDAATNNPEIKEIKPPVASDTPIVLQEMPRKTHYFAKGTVDAKGDNWITINDHQFIIAPDVNLGCGVGDFVGIQVNDERKVVSCKRIKK